MMIRALAVLVAALGLSACWQHAGSLYNGVMPVQPLTLGVYGQTSTTTNVPTVYDLQPDGSGYRLVPKGDVLTGASTHQVSAFTLHALPGAPVPGVYVAETQQFECDVVTGDCKDLPANAPHYYSLLVVKADGIFETRPDCDLTNALAAKYGVYDAGQKTCTFNDHVSVEKALLELGATTNPNYLYKPQ